MTGLDVAPRERHPLQEVMVPHVPNISQLTRRREGSTLGLLDMEMSSGTEHASFGPLAAACVKRSGSEPVRSFSSVRSIVFSCCLATPSFQFTPFEKLYSVFSSFWSSPKASQKPLEGRGLYRSRLKTALAPRWPSLRRDLCTSDHRERPPTN